MAVVRARRGGACPAPSVRTAFGTPGAGRLPAVGWGRGVSVGADVTAATGNLRQGLEAWSSELDVAIGAPACGRS
ncbi:hypothetical protein [Streptomyces violaceusniger]|uniref:hypothetical protein n=1 Tax=Streptomyces violaceusniger TaxID=68280 RepID=UPI00138732C0